MRNLSTEFKEQQNIGNHNYLKFVDITLKNGTALHLDNSDLWNNGFSFEDSVSSDDNFDIGSAIINKFNVVINNIEDKFSEYSFAGAKAIVYVGLNLSNGIEKIRICTGEVSEEPKQRSSIITLSFLDNMAKFDRDYADVKTIFPATRNQVVRDICSTCGVPLQTVNFDHDDYIIQTRPDNESLTCRQMLAWVVQIGCQWAKCDEYGRLCVGWYKDIRLGEIVINSDGSMEVNEKDFSGNKTPINLLVNSELTVYPNKGEFAVEGGRLIYKASEKTNRPIDIKRMSNLSVDLEDISITGVKVTEYKNNASEEAPANTYMYGKDGYVLEISGNKLISENTGENIARIIGEKCVGIRFRPFSANCITDISMEAGDSVAVTDRKGNVFLSYITNVKLKPGNFEQISCGAKSYERNSAKQYSLITQVQAESKKNIQKEKTERQKALEELSNRLENSPGVFTTVETDAGGGKTYYLHNKPKLEESDMVWKMTAEALAVSTDGGKTWNAGMTVDGDIISRILTATGVNADWINTGALVVRDTAGEVLFNADIDTGRVDIAADTFTLKGLTIDEIAQGKVNNFVSGIFESTISDLQKQIDGQIETYYYDYEPTLENKPASQWTDESEKQKHQGDLFYWKSKGFAYRFMKENELWKWQIVKDTDVTKALADAAEAKDTADSKRRVFVSTPQPPYDIGDLWVQGEKGDIMRCAQDRKTGLFLSSDWIKASKYTDDSALTNFINGEFKTQIDNLKKQTDGKAETWFQSTDPSLSWTTSESKSEHVGDMWYNTSDQRYYRWNGTTWSELEMKVPDTVFDSIDGKAQIFVSTPKPPYDIGDLWVTSTSSMYAGIKFCVFGRETGDFDAKDWVDLKYVDKNEVNSSIQSYDTSLGQTEIFNKLTNGGLDQGIYIQNGKLYINADYILAGVLAGKFVNAKGIKVSDVNNNTTFYIDDNGNVTIRANTFSLQGNTIENIANSAAGSALESAKEYTDGKIKDFKPDINLTQQEIFNILTNNGQTQGIYLSNGKIYINASYINTGYLAGWQVNGNSLQAKVGLNKITLDAGSAKLQIENDTSYYHPSKGSRYGTTLQGADIKTHNVDCFDINALNIDILENLKVYKTADFVKPAIMRNLSHVTAGGHLVFAKDGMTLAYLASSSKRYKEHISEMNLNEAEKILNIPVVWFRYRDGYLAEDDLKNGKPVPGFYAEDVYKYFPDAADLNADEIVEDWNYRTLIPPMLKLIQEQEKEINRIKSDFNSFKENISYEIEQLKKAAKHRDIDV